jgi:hypothetical protein
MFIHTEGTVNNLTEQLMLYRECARVVWNLFLRNYDDGEHEFGDVDGALFSAMIESQCQQTAEPITIRGETFYAHLRLSPRRGLETLLVLQYQNEDNRRVWGEKRVNASTLDIRFSRLFDFDTVNGSFRDFRYVYAVVVRSDVIDVPIGSPLLIETDSLDLFDTSGPRPEFTETTH